MSNSTDSGRLDMSEWESVTLDRAAWNMLTRQLEDLLALGCLLVLKPPPPPASEGVGPASPTPSPEPIRVSVKRVLDGGRGQLFALLSAVLL